MRFQIKHRCCFQGVNRMLKDIWSDKWLFGRLPLVIDGNFEQILPFIRHRIRVSTVAASTRNSDVWPQLCLHFLTPNMRLFNNHDNQMFAKWLEETSYKSWIARLDWAALFHFSNTINGEFLWICFSYCQARRCLSKFKFLPGSRNSHISERFSGGF